MARRGRRHSLRILSWLGLLGAAALAVAWCARDGATLPGWTKPPPAPTSPLSSSMPPSPADLDSERVLVARIDELRRGGRDGRYVEPTTAELDAFRAWIGTAVTRARAGEDPPAECPAGFVLERQRASGGELWLLCERPDAKRGAGAIVLRRGGARELLVEAPHTFFDAGTLPIAVTAFAESRARALLVNTVHRHASRRGRDARDDGESDDDKDPAGSDVAHAAASFFLAAHDEASARAGAPALQLHGFGDSAVPGASVVLSAAGTNAKIDDVATAVSSVIDRDRVRVYPRDVRRLGGTTNVQARSSARAGRAFVHAELSRTFRDQLLGDPAIRARFARAAADALVPPEPAAEGPR